MVSVVKVLLNWNTFNGKSADMLQISIIKGATAVIQNIMIIVSASLDCQYLLIVCNNEHALRHDFPTIDQIVTLQKEIFLPDVDISDLVSTKSK